MAETRVAQVIDALVTGMRATAGFRSPTSASTTAGLTTVYDGPEVWTTDDRDGQSLLVIGYSGSTLTSRPRRRSPASPAARSPYPPGPGTKCP
jgi:hypothetical protein